MVSNKFSTPGMTKTRHLNQGGIRFCANMSLNDKDSPRVQTRRSGERIIHEFFGTGGSVKIMRIFQIGSISPGGIHSKIFDTTN